MSVPLRPLAFLGSSVLFLAASFLSAAPKPPGMNPKALQAWMDSAAPVAAHQKLQALVGTWTTHQQDWLPTGELWNEADGSATCHLLLGGRFVQEDYTTTLNGHPFHGLGVTGFDRQKNAYVAMWLDDFGTGFIPLEGTFDAAGRVLTLVGGVPPGRTTGGWRMTDTWWDKDHHTVAWWGQGIDGKPVKLSEIRYTRNL